MLKLHSLRQLSGLHPVQWVATTDDGRPVFIHHKWGRLKLWVGRVGGGEDEARGGELVLDCDLGREKEPGVEWDEVAAAAGIILEDRSRAE